MKKTLFAVLSFTFLAGFFGCQVADVPIASVVVTAPSTSFTTFVPPEKPKSAPVYTYKGMFRRDPFISLLAEGTFSDNEIIIPRISALELKGIVRNDKNDMAVLTASGYSYFLNNGKLMDRSQRVIRGITGEVKKESVVVRSTDGTRKEIFIREK